MPPPGRGPGQIRDFAFVLLLPNSEGASPLGTPRHALSRAASPARSVRVARVAALARVWPRAPLLPHSEGRCPSELPDTRPPWRSATADLAGASGEVGRSRVSRKGSVGTR